MIIAYGNSAFKYPESFGSLQKLIPENARSLQWFLDLPEDLRREIAKTIAEKGFVNAVKAIQFYCKVSGEPEPKVAGATKKKPARIVLGDSPVHYLLVHDRYVLIIDRCRISTEESFKLCYRHVAIARLPGRTIIKFGASLSSLRSKVGREAAKTKGIVKISDFTIYALKPAAMGV